MNDNVFQRFVNIVVNPTAAMAGVRERPLWPAAALAVVLLVGLFSAATMHIAGPEQLELMEDTRFGRMMSEEQLDGMYADYQDISLRDRIVNGLSAGFGSAVTVLIVALVYLLFGKLAGGRASFRQVLGVVFWASVVSLGLGALVKWPLVLAKGSVMDVALGPAILVAHRGPLDWLYGLLSMFDVFTIWGVVLTVIGFEQVQGFDRNKATTVVVAAYLLISLVMFGIGRLFV